MPPVDVAVAYVGLLAVAVTARVVERTWLGPGAFFALYWNFMVALSLAGPLLGVEAYPLWSGAIWWITANLGLVLVGSIVGKAFTRIPHRANIDIDEAMFPYVTAVIITCTIAGLIWLWLFMFLVPAGTNPNLIIQPLLGLHFTGPLIGGALFACSRTRNHRALALMTLVPGIIYGVATSGRNSLVTQFEFWFASYFAMTVLTTRWHVPLFTRARVLAASACLTLFIGAGVVFTIFRQVPLDTPLLERYARYSETVNSEQMAASWDYMQSGIFGQVAMFSWYFEQSWTTPPTPKFPTQTAAGLYRAFGGELPEAIYTDIGGISTNVFTIFKPPIEDYGLLGSLFVAFAFGLMGGWSYQQARAGRLMPASLLVVFYTNSLNPGGWFLTYNSVTGSYILLAAYLLWIDRTRERATLFTRAAMSLADGGSGPSPAGTPLAPRLRNELRSGSGPITAHVE